MFYIVQWETTFICFCWSQKFTPVSLCDIELSALKKKEMMLKYKNLLVK